MWEFIQGLLFANVFMIAGPGDFAPGNHRLELKEPISAISETASFRLDITNMVPEDARTLEKSRAWIRSTFPDHSVRATLHSADGAEVNLAFDGATSWNTASIQLIIRAPEGVPKGVSYSSASLSTDLQLRQVTVSWANYKP